MNCDDEKIKKAFQQLRAKDERNAPAFERLWQAASSRKAKMPQTRFIFRLAAAVVLIVLTGSLVIYFKQNMPTDSPTVASLSEWRSPTDPLLELTIDEFPEYELFAQAAQMGASLSQWQSPTNSLLRLPGHGFLKTMPPPGGSKIEL